jgi:hypothetical protein
MTEFLLGIALGIILTCGVLNRATVKGWIDALRKKGP